MTDVTRRGLLRAAGAAGIAASAGAAVAAGNAAGDAAGDVTASATATREAIPFFGAHQQGITTPQQAALCLASFALQTDSASELRSLMQRWSVAAERMTRGLPAAPQPRSAADVPADSGDVDGMLPGRLTMTFGFGPRVFALKGLASRRPAGLVPLPHFRGDELDAAAPVATSSSRRAPRTPRSHSTPCGC